MNITDKASVYIRKLKKKIVGVNANNKLLLKLFRLQSNYQKIFIKNTKVMLLHKNLILTKDYVFKNLVKISGVV